ncbi:uncharacterized protein LOC132039170 [Lycium ferocissimum]|uniref:uncharacterized protein LOC132039170 n=1 Tax=Lycium ferocissimum TaxID=112874 RepID=UPI002814F5E6|nr:uncharacterized protein LOC132039170 [Lycium ferocissimum]
MINALSWNIRGMESQVSTERLKYMIDNLKISLVVIQEPFVKESKIDNYKYILGMEGCHANTSNKIWIFWKQNLECTIYATEDQMVTCKISHNSVQKEFLLSVVYAKSKASGREDLWGYMRIIASVIDLPWVVCGDFNCILACEEKLGGKDHRLTKSIPFIECLQDCDFRDVGYTGDCFTWSNERKEQKVIWKRLDRMVINNDWEDWFSKTSVQHLPRVFSDHCPPLISFGNE